MKVFLRFSKTFFDKNIIGGKISAAYFDDSVGKLNSDSILMAFIMGEQAEKLSSRSSHLEITNALLQELDEMYDKQASKYFIKSHIEDWTVNPFIRGAYSYSTVGMGNARKIAAQSIQNKIFFAGEAMNRNGHHQTVHGAMETGYQAVRNIIDTLKK